MKVNLIRVNGAMKIAFLLICYLATCVQLSASPQISDGTYFGQRSIREETQTCPV